MKVGLVCRPGTPLVEMFTGSAIAVHPISRSGWGALTSVFRIARIIRKGRYKIVDIQRGHDIIQSLIASLISFQRPVLIYTPQVPEFMQSKFLLGLMDRIVTISRYIRDKIASFAPAAAKKTSIVHYGIDLEKFNPSAVQKGFLRGRFGLLPETPLIGTVGDLWKNQIEFLDALVVIRREFPDARYVMVASDTGIGQIDTFRSKVKSLGLSDAVLWTGRLSKEEIRSFFADIDIAVSTHRNEGFGIWILEALAMGKPVVAFNEGGIRDPLEGCLSGVLVTGNADDMAREVIRIMKDDTLRAKMSHAGPRWVVEKFSRERMVEDYDRLFQSVVHGA